MANTREFLLFSDCTMANPNGDMINDNRPRYDEGTGKLEMSDVRIKRCFREEADNRGLKVFVRPTKDDKGKDKGKYLDCKGVAKKIIEDNFPKDKDGKDKLEGLLKSDYIDVKLFGAVVTEPKFNITGPLQVMWSKSIHEAEIKFAQGTASFTSAEGKAQGTTWSKYYTPYALFKTYMVYNDKAAERQDIKLTEEDLDNFKDILLSGIRNYKSTSKNQMPRILVEVIYNKNYIDGELDYVKVEYNKQDLELREVDEFTFDFSSLTKFVEGHKDVVKGVNIYLHPKVKVENIATEFNIIYM
ncbi:type I-B CRISPR-associated protein Cas7/Csh2 [Clostridium sp. BSD9I1]|uniref:type I-B CRISPR-associated protein Cas7/Csh2 n=1 Tax=Clostridium sp. BSD9I1 TaxID=2003589 RepID=UPI001648048A|nr:type I-B CRISPR-associated protein Cas7/Csh2 [Clostridium sp. BSD9I1]